MTDNLGQPPTRLLAALERGDFNAAMEAILAGDDVNVRDTRPIIGDDATALHLAALKGNVWLVRELIRHGADINGQTGYGQTALWFACNQGHTHVIQELLTNGADAAIVNKDGYAPGDRIRAADTSTIEMYEKLLNQRK